ncbi:MAG: amino acid racemase [Alicyclobacillus sp.]|nr:amino acid racemase [Alicyclobacillus sp.]
MKRIGIVGGLSAESTVEFYRQLIRTYVDRFGDTGYPEIIIHSVSFKKFWDWSLQQEWDRFAIGIVQAVLSLEKAGADFGVIAANMPHVVFDDVKAQTSLPLLHIADGVAFEAQSHGYTCVALLGTIPTMKAKFYPARLKKYGVRCIVPDAAEQQIVQNILESELFLGDRTRESERNLIEIVNALKSRGAEAAILACTELPMLLNSKNSPVPLLDSEALLVRATLETALSD